MFNSLNYSIAQLNLFNNINLICYNYPAMSKIVNPKEGYNLYADNYKNDYRKLELFDKGKFLEFLPDFAENCIDLGIGDGRIVDFLKTKTSRLVGVDVSSKMLANCLKKSGSTELVCADLDFSVPFKSDFFDLAVAYFLFVHIKDAKGFIEEVNRVLKPGGVFLFNLIHQKKPPELKAGKSKFKIKSYYHIPSHIEEYLNYFWFEWEREDILEGKFWVSKIYRCVKT